MTIDSLRRCLTALIVVLAIGVGPGVSQAFADHASEGHNGSEESARARCGGHHDHGDEDREDGREKGKGCRDEGHDDEGHNEDHDDGGHNKGHSKDHDDEGHDDEGHDDESGDREEGEDHRSAPADDGEDDGGAEPEGRRSGDGHWAGDTLGARGRAAPSPTPSGAPTGPIAASLEITVTASRAVARVGDEIDYTVTVTNTGAAELAGVTVVDLVPPELDVVSVPLAEGVEAAQAGVSPRGEDVVWILETLPARVSVELSWTGVVRELGDLEATNVATATFAGSETTASTTTFLAASTGVAAKKIAPEVRPKRIVTVTRVPAAAAAPGAPLPVTALGIEWLLGLALAIFFAGITLLIIGRPPLAVGRGSAYALALLAVVYAATFIGDSSKISEPRQAQPRPSETVEDEVKGKRIFKNGARPTPTPEAEDEVERGGDGRTGPVAAPADEAEEMVLVRTVRTVRVPVEAMPVPSTRGANVFEFSWDEPSRRIVLATSSLGPIERRPTVELLTSLGTTGEAIGATVVLRNVSDSFIAVRGVLWHDVTGGDISLRLSSRRIDVVLRPGGEVRATYRYLLPSGDYQAGADFVAD